MQRGLHAAAPHPDWVQRLLVGGGAHQQLAPALQHRERADAVERLAAQRPQRRVQVRRVLLLLPLLLRVLRLVRAF